MSEPRTSTWRRSASLVAAFALAATAALAGGAAASADTESPDGFTDINSDSKFYTEIMWLADEGITTGYTADNTFRPHWPVTRDAMAAFMYRLAGEPDFTAPEEPPFADITVDTKFYKEISWLESTGVTTGFADNGYKPYQPVTRDAMAAFMYRLAGAPEYVAPVESPFADITPESKFYKEISWLADEGISKGWDVDNTYRPFEDIERNAMAAFMYRFMDGVGVGVEGGTGDDGGDDNGNGGGPGDGDDNGNGDDGGDGGDDGGDGGDDGGDDGDDGGDDDNGEVPAV